MTLISICCRASPGNGIRLRRGRRLSDFRRSMVCPHLPIFWKLPNAILTAILPLMKSAPCWILITIPSPVVPMMPTLKRLTRFQPTSPSCSTNKLSLSPHPAWLPSTDVFLKAFSSSPVSSVTAIFPRKNGCCVVNPCSM